jgi:hypothetical protein
MSPEKCRLLVVNGGLRRHSRFWRPHSHRERRGANQPIRSRDLGLSDGGER